MRFHLLQNMQPTAEEVRAWREAGNGGLQEGARALQKQKVLDGLDVLTNHLAQHPAERDEVLQDLIEIVKILAAR